MRKLKYLVITSLLLFMSCKEKEEKLDTEKLKQIANTYGQFAPDDAYENGSEFPYYGSENEWTRRQFSEAGATRLYKRRGQRQLLEILDGNLKKALELTEIRLKENNEDAESYFIQTIVYSQMNKIQKATEAMNRALENGMSFSRFMAGPRDLLATLYESS
jgi:tetratricopeptide (TPR) repeat protein